MAKKRTSNNHTAVRKEVEYRSARQFYVDHGKEPKEIAELVGVGYKTVLSWVKGNPDDPNYPDWRKLRAAQTMSKSDQLRDIAAQIQQINSAIKKREEGERYANSKEADIINKLTKAYNYLETDLGVREIVDVSMELLPFIKKYSSEDADLMKGYLDKFINMKVAQAR